MSDLKGYCDFCRLDIFNRKELIKENIDFGVFGKSELSALISCNEEGYHMGVALINGIDGNDLVYASPKINFCPMCGRKLGE
jgi:hypothetical protein